MKPKEFKAWLTGVIEGVGSMTCPPPLVWGRIKKEVEELEVEEKEDLITRHWHVD